MKNISDQIQLCFSKACFQDAKTGDKDGYCGGFQVGNGEEERGGRRQTSACLLLSLWPDGNHFGQVTPIIFFPESIVMNIFSFQAA